MAMTSGVRHADIVGLTADSRQVRPGYLFAALKGVREDGAAYIDDAIARGATAVLGVPDAVHAYRARQIAVIADRNPRRAYALMAARFYRAQPKTIVAVTGTNGKTSVATFARQIWSTLGRRAASIGTLGIHGPGMTNPGSLTTPDPAQLHQNLVRLAENRVDHLAIEASSHGLDQHRMDGVRLTAAGFTNLSRDHLDYHGNEARYLAAKARLFETVMAPGGVAVLNADVPQYQSLAESCYARGHRIIAYGAKYGDGTRRDLRIVRRETSARGQVLSVRIGGSQHVIDTSLVGDFQVMNLLCAVGLIIGSGEDVGAAVRAAAGVSGPTGRMQCVTVHPNGAAVYVDYAHTPDALQTVLTALRPHVRGQLHLVFGCGGDRDRGKRPVMGEIAARLADRVFVTDDNPRFEDPSAIRAEILATCSNATEIGDRGKAIRTAIADLTGGDLLLIAGKGHETDQLVGDQVLPFDDAAVARDAVAAIGDGKRAGR